MLFICFHQKHIFITMPCVRNRCGFPGAASNLTSLGLFPHLILDSALPLFPVSTCPQITPIHHQWTRQFTPLHMKFLMCTEAISRGRRVKGKGRGRWMKIFICHGMTSCSVSIECHVNTKLRLLAIFVLFQWSIVSNLYWLSQSIIIILFATNHCNQPTLPP